MKIEKLLNQVKIINTEYYEDHRGYVTIPFDQELCQRAMIEFKVKQINQGFSNKANTLRGLHFQFGDSAQAKIVSCLNGAIYSVAVDITPNSPTYRQSCASLLTRDNGKLMYIPRGFAHGYLALEDETLMQWLVDKDFDGSQAKTIAYDDKQLDIDWYTNMSKVIVSAKDKAGLTIEQYEKLLEENL